MPTRSTKTALQGVCSRGHAGSHRTLPELPMNFLDSTLRDWKVTLEPIAAKKPGQLNVTCSTLMPGNQTGAERKQHWSVTVPEWSWGTGHGLGADCYQFLIVPHREPSPAVLP